MSSWKCWSISWFWSPRNEGMIMSVNGRRYVQQYKEKEKLSHRYWAPGPLMWYAIPLPWRTFDLYLFFCYMQMELWFVRLWGCAFILRNIFSLVCWNKLQHFFVVNVNYYIKISVIFRDIKVWQKQDRTNIFILSSTD